jgi:hypothetical protein
MRGIFPRTSPTRRITVGLVGKLVLVFAVIYFIRYLAISGNRGIDGYNFGNVLVQCFYRSFATLENYQRDSQKRLESLTAACSSRAGFLDPEYPTDKCSSHGYTKIYDQLFSVQREKPVRLLEVGVKKGGSLKLWRDYFSIDSMIYGLDINQGAPQFQYEPNIKVLLGDSRDPLSSVFERQCLDIIVDDGYHSLTIQRETFENLSRYLCPSGKYLVEDVIDVDGMKTYLDERRQSLKYVHHMDKSGQALFIIQWA